MISRRYEDFAVDHLNWNRRGDSVNAKVMCLFHDDSDPSMSFHLDKGAFHCWACKAKGGIQKLARQLGMTVKGDVVLELEDPTADFEAFMRDLDELSNPPVLNVGSLPEEWLLRYQAIPTDYWTVDRGILPRVQEAWGLGYDPLDNHATMPLRTANGDLIGVIRRQLDKGAKPKYLNPKGYAKRASFYGSWMRAPVPRSDAVVLVEGPVDALKVYQAGYHAMAILGGEFTDDQAIILHRLGYNSIVSFFDADDAGFEIAKGLYWTARRDFELKVATYRLKDPNDPGSMTSAQIRRAITNGVSLRPY